MVEMLVVTLVVAAVLVVGLLVAGSFLAVALIEAHRQNETNVRIIAELTKHHRPRVAPSGRTPTLKEWRESTGR